MVVVPEVREVLEVLEIREVPITDWTYRIHEAYWTNRAYQPDETNEVVSHSRVLQVGLRDRGNEAKNLPQSPPSSKGEGL